MKSHLVLSLLFAAGCTVQSPKADDACERACAHMADLCAELGPDGACSEACEASAPDEDGVSCVAVCANAERSGVITLNPECRAHAETCEAVNDCSGLDARQP